MIIVKTFIKCMQVRSGLIEFVRLRPTNPRYIIYIKSTTIRKVTKSSQRFCGHYPSSNDMYLLGTFFNRDSCN